ncbi:MAG: hypothetical protein AB9856_10265 [Cellulosilyticaceae bacterium]
MDYDKLIDLIVNEVYNKIKELPSIEKVPAKKAVVFWDDALEKYSLLENAYEVIPYKQEVRECDIIIISKLCLRGLYNLSQGSNVSDEERFILKMIMKGKKVYALNDGIEYKRYKATAPKTLYNKYIKCEDELKGFGVRIINDIAEIITDTKTVVSEIVSSETASQDYVITEPIAEREFEIRNKKLISESDLRKPKLGQVTTVVIDKKSIITPLANDFIRMNHLKVKRV